MSVGVKLAVTVLCNKNEVDTVVNKLQSYLTATSKNPWHIFIVSLEASLVANDDPIMIVGSIYWTIASSSRSLGLMVSTSAVFLKLSGAAATVTSPGDGHDANGKLSLELHQTDPLELLFDK
ncbi:hypothetical protein GX51_06354 [Blastomyces parvus]|uniref:Uncharacterized protein n=1 Tax=Blastomyces parvus TaxID=2060905 RepID=A0A2B7WRW9_9EURO|nr:hypothetical protein GX51_06354 [Blastomyces parvus]